ncbi:hypothetical protein ARAF_0207 [Arsenophonus endosymbiont of Aleurodicus floccissimus]|nr:hypothetical protein ARAF_0207 [Arsenophonus endosymbiont of Aleurodicus floccissimus]
MHNEWQEVLDFWFKESTNKQWLEKNHNLTLSSGIDLN